MQTTPTTQKASAEPESGTPGITRWTVDAMRVMDTSGRIVASCYRTDRTQAECTAVAQTIVIAVNACAGIPAPATAIVAAREALLVADEYLHEYLTDSGREAIRKACRQVSAAYKLLNTEP